MDTTTTPDDFQRVRPLKLLRRERLRISNACQQCRSRKTKCDGARPVCTKCQAKAQTCSYGYNGTGTGTPINVGQKNRHNNKPLNVQVYEVAGSHSHAPVSSTPTLQQPTPPSPSTSSVHFIKAQSPGQELEPGSEQARNHYTAHGPFAGQVAAAIAARAGVAPPATSTNLVPFVDAPLFGEIELDSLHSAASSTNLPEFHLPPRAYTDRLVGIYWQHVHPIEPFLDREQFSHDYDTLYGLSREALLHPDHAIRLSILYVLIAVAIQRQEATALQRRDEEANGYFQLAWRLLRPEMILWKPGSLELVQCLMMINRYLHCTNNQHKTWMTVGMAMRVAQSIGCHLPETLSAKGFDNDRQLKRRVWVSCVALDRCVNWVLGKTSAPSFLPLYGQSRADATFPSGGNTDHLIRGLELHEIGNQIQLAQTGAWSHLGPSLGLPQLYEKNEYHIVAVQMDECLSKWEKNLPDDWGLQSLQYCVDGPFRAERYLTHLRLFHMRIFLYRPMLARFFSLNSTTATSTAQATSSSITLSDRLVRECAAMCIEAAQRLTSLVMETLEPDSSMGLLPWWYRIYYLHVAGINFLAAMFTSDLFTESVSKSWETVMSALRAHDHLSAYVQQCIRIFETLSARALESRYPNSVNHGDGLPPDSFLVDNLFQDVNFDFDDFLCNNMEGI